MIITSIDFIDSYIQINGTYIYFMPEFIGFHHIFIWTLVYFQLNFQFHISVKIKY